MVSLNARVGAVALTVGSAATVALSLAPQLVPLRFVAFGLCVFGAWAFADEMGLRKPLNRAGMVALVFAAGAKSLVLLNVGTSAAAGGSLLYAFSLLLALLLWSLAFLHRDKRLKIVGAIGASVAVLPIVALIAGHVFVGIGALWGIGTLYGATYATNADTPEIISIIELVFLVWSLFAAVALWTGQIESPQHQ